MSAQLKSRGGRGVVVTRGVAASAFSELRRASELAAALGCASRWKGGVSGRGPRSLLLMQIPFVQDARNLSPSPTPLQPDATRASGSCRPASRPGHRRARTRTPRPQRNRSQGGAGAMRVPKEVRSLRAQGLCVIAETVEQRNVLSTDLEVARPRSLVGSLSSFVNLPTHLIGVASPLSHGDPARDPGRIALYEMRCRCHAVDTRPPKGLS